jgi:hypothetical protein
MAAPARKRKMSGATSRRKHMAAPLRVVPEIDAAPIPTLSWDSDIPIATHPVMLANFGMLFAVTGALIAALLSFVLFVTGRVLSIEPMLEWTASSTAAAFLLALLLATVLFGNRLPMRFKLDASSAEAEVRDKSTRLAARAAGVFSWVANRFSLAGAGLIAETSARQHILWDDVATAHFHPLWRTVSLSNGWHVVLILFCSPGNYDAVAAAVHTGLAARHPHSFHNPLPGLLFRTFLVLLSCMPLFAMPYVEKDGVFPALVILGFGLASVWLMPSLAWVVLAALGWAAVLEVLAQVKLRDSLFGGTFRAYQVLNMGEAITLGLTIAGMACLAALSIGLLAGRVRTGLAGDRIERDMRR